MTIPLESRELLEEMARRSGQVVAAYGDPQLPAVAMYLPYLFDPQRAGHDGDPDIEPRLAEFEDVFAVDDPWEYGSAYEQRKYKETLALLPRHMGSALEVGCAEGVFTQMLAERADRLLAVDVSQTAIARRRADPRSGATSSSASFDLFRPALLMVTSSWAASTWWCAVRSCIMPLTSSRYGAGCADSSWRPNPGGSLVIVRREPRRRPTRSAGFPTGTI